MRGKFRAFSSTTVKRAAAGCQHNDINSSPRPWARIYVKNKETKVKINYEPRNLPITRVKSIQTARVPLNFSAESLCSVQLVDFQFVSNRYCSLGIQLHQ